MAPVPASEDAEMVPEVQYVVERPATYDLKLYPELRHAITSMDKDFFKSQLSETDRRTFYASCPRNEGMEYTPPSLPDMGQSQSARRQDAVLYDLQYKLSGITRPIDYFIHQCIQGDGAVSRKDAVDFANNIRDLVSDVASTITQQRIDYMFRSMGIQGSTPKFREEDQN
ncbi:hypothetical protein AX774_g2108, partial [Zancudomyces culisetae]